MESCPASFLLHLQSLDIANTLYIKEPLPFVTLTHLSILEVFETDEFDLRLLSLLTNLSTLSLSHPLQESSSSAFLSLLPNLKRLYVKGLENLSESVLSQLTQLYTISAPVRPWLTQERFPFLRELVTHLTESIETQKELARSLPLVESLFMTLLHPTPLTISSFLTHLHTLAIKAIARVTLSPLPLLEKLSLSEDVQLTNPNNFNACSRLRELTMGCHILLENPDMFEGVCNRVPAHPPIR